MLGLARFKPIPGISWPSIAATQRTQQPVHVANHGLPPELFLLFWTGRILPSQDSQLCIKLPYTAGTKS